MTATIIRVPQCSRTTAQVFVCVQRGALLCAAGSAHPSDLQPGPRARRRLGATHLVLVSMTASINDGQVLCGGGESTGEHSEFYSLGASVPFWHTDPSMGRG